MTLALIALFLPLFPLSVVQNLILARVRAPSVRAALLLLWPQLGVTLLQLWRPDIPAFIVVWAIVSAAFYAFRLLTVRDLGVWASLFASSALALTWGLAAHGADETALRLFALWFSLPAALLLLLTGPLTQRLGAAYAGLFAGIAERQPRLAFVLTAVVLTAIATPPFPGFFALLDLLRNLGGGGALGVLGVWLIWGWAATRLLQGFVAASGREVAGDDLKRGGILMYTAALTAFAVAGLLIVGGGL